MRKLFALLLVCTTLLSLTACGGDTSNWKTKDVAVPDMKLTTQNVDFTSSTGVQDKVIVSPFDNNINPETAAKTIQNMKYMKSATLTHQYTENAVPIFDGDIQQMYYTYRDLYTIEQLDGNKIILQYIKSPDDVLGYSTISVEIFEDDKKIPQKTILEILNAVYGNQWAEFLCYGEMKKDGDIDYYENMQDTCTLVCERIIKEDMGAAFIISIVNLDETPVYGYDGGFQMKAKGFNVLAELLHWDIKDMPYNIQNMGLDFIQKYYGTEAHLTPGVFSMGGVAYAYEYEESEDGYTVKMQYVIKRSDDDKEGLIAHMSLSEKHGVQTTSCTFEIQRLQNATGEECATAKQLTLQMVQDIMGDVDASNALTEGQTYRMILNDKEVAVNWRFVFASHDGYQIPTLTMETSTDVNAFVQ